MGGGGDVEEGTTKDLGGKSLKLYAASGFQGDASFMALFTMQWWPQSPLKINTALINVKEKRNSGLS